MGINRKHWEQRDSNMRVPKRQRTQNTITYHHRKAQSRPIVTIRNEDETSSTEEERNIQGTVKLEDLK